MGYHGESGKLFVTSAEKDKNLIITSLLEAKVFTFIKGIYHLCFEEIEVNIVLKVLIIRTFTIG